MKVASRAPGFPNHTGNYYFFLMIDFHTVRGVFKIWTDFLTFSNMYNGSKIDLSIFLFVVTNIKIKMNNGKGIKY